jgi:hypothetical protein
LHRLDVAVQQRDRINNQGRLRQWALSRRPDSRSAAAAPSKSRAVGRPVIGVSMRLP